MLRYKAFSYALAVSALSACSAYCANQAYPLPPAQKISFSKPVDCRAVATEFMSEKQGAIVTETSVGTDHLSIRRLGRRLHVVAHHEATHLKDDYEIYNISSETADFLSANQAAKMIPVVHGIVINKRLGSAVWTESDSTFILVSDYPMSSSVFLNCKN